jgi:hypothetical protein
MTARDERPALPRGKAGTSFKITVSYARPGEPDRHPNEFPGLSANRAETGLGAFLRDMLYLVGSAVQRITIEREQS